MRQEIFRKIKRGSALLCAVIMLLSAMYNNMLVSAASELLGSAANAISEEGAGSDAGDISQTSSMASISSGSEYYLGEEVTVTLNAPVVEEQTVEGSFSVTDSNNSSLELTTSEGITTFILPTAVAGEGSLTIIFTPTDTTSSATTEVLSYIVNKIPVVVTLDGTYSKTYDGTTAFSANADSVTVSVSLAEGVTGRVPTAVDPSEVALDTTKLTDGSLAFVLESKSATTDGTTCSATLVLLENCTANELFGIDANTYEVTVAPIAVTVAKASLTCTVTPAGKNYDGNTDVKEISVNFDGKFGEDAVELGIKKGEVEPVQIQAADVVFTDAGSAGGADDVAIQLADSTWEIVLIGDDAGNYTLSSKNITWGTADIASNGTPVINITGVDTSSVNDYYYGETVTATLEAKVDEETLSGEFSVSVKKPGDEKGTPVEVSANEEGVNSFLLPTEYVGENLEVTVAFRPESDLYDTADSKTVTYNVKKVPITIGLSAKEESGFSKVYDGTTEYSISADEIIVSTALGDAVGSRVEAPMVAFVNDKLTEGNVSFVLENKNATEDGNTASATMVLSDETTLYDLFGVSADAYEIQNTDVKIGVEITKAPLTFTVTPSDKYYDMSDAVEEILSVECTGAIYTVDGIKDDVALSIASADLKFENAGSVEETTPDVKIRFAQENYVPVLVGNDKDNYKVDKADITLNGADIIAQTENVEYGQNSNYVEFTPTYTDEENSVYWISKKDGLTVTAKESYSIATSEGEDTIFVAEVTGLTSGKDDKIVVYVKDEEDGDVMQVTLEDIKTDATEPKMSWGIDESLLMQNDSYTCTVEVTDTESGFKTLEYKLDDSAWEGVDTNTFTLNVPKYGCLYVRTIDNVGNTSEETFIRPLVLEQDAPQLTITIDEDKIDAEEISKALEDNTYCIEIFETDENGKKITHKSSHSFNVVANDNPSNNANGYSGIKEISWKLLDYLGDELVELDGVRGSETPEKTPEELTDLINFASFNLNGGNAIEINNNALDSKMPYILEITAIDYCNNKSTVRFNIYFDNVAPTYSIDIDERGVTNSHEVDTETNEVTDYYNTEFKVNVSVKEDASFDANELSLIVYKDGEDEAYAELTGAVYEYDETAQLWNGNYTINESSLGEVKFVDGEYAFELKGTDASGKDVKFAGEVHHKVVYDVTAPEITAISYTYVDEDDTEKDAAELFIKDIDDGRDYIRKDVTLSFTVNEHNLTNNSLGSIAENGTEVNKDNEDDRALTLEWVKNEDINTASFVVGQRGDYGDQQTAIMTIVDKAGNTAELNADVELRSTEDGHTTFNKGTFKDVFTVDKEAPVITDISYSYVNAAGEAIKAEDLFKYTADDERYYINKEVTLKVTVDEYNLPNASKVSHFNDNKSLLPSWNWEKDSNIATQSVKFQELTGNEQSFELTIVDRAGNTAVLQYDAEQDIDLKESLKEAGVLEKHAAFDEEKGQFTDAFTVDITTPEIIAIDYTYINEDGEVKDATEIFVKEADDGRDYIREDVTLSFTVNEHNLTSNSQGSITEDGAEVDEANADDKALNLEWVKNADINTTAFTVGQRGDYGDQQTSILIIEDRAGNKAVLKLGEDEKLRCETHTSFEAGTFTDVFTVDKETPVITGIAYTYEGEAGEVKDATELFIKEADDGRDYIREDVTLFFTVNEHNLTNNSLGSITENGTEVNKDNTYDKSLDLIWSKDGDIKTAAFIVGQRGNDGDQQTTILTIVDRAGNKAVLEEGEKLRCETHTSFEAGTFKDIFTVDKIAPEITGINYTYVDEAGELKDATEIFIQEADDGSDYIRKDVTLSFTVDEHNLTNNSLGSITENGTEVNKDNAYDKSLDLMWAKNKDINTTSFTVGQRGNDGDQQTSVLTIVDRAGNKAVLGEGEILRCENHTTFAEGTFTDVFTVDKIAPEITAIDYTYVDDNGEVKDATKLFIKDTDDGRDYIRKPVTITFKVDEHNLTYLSDMSITAFDDNLNPENVKVVDNEQYAKWNQISEENEDEYKAFFTVGQRGEKGDQQTSILTIKDRAGNEAVLSLEEGKELRCETHTTFVAGTFKDVFTVDTVAPEVTLSYDMTPVISIDETEGTVDYFSTDSLAFKVSVYEHNFNRNNNLTIDVDWSDKTVKAFTDEAWVYNGDTNSKLYTLKEDSLYKFIITGTDRAGNEIVLMKDETKPIHPVQNEETRAITLLTAVDDTLPLTGDFSNPKVEILGVHAPSPSGSDICGENHPLYNSDVTYMVRVYDPLKNNYASGIDGITFKVTSAAGVEGTVTIDKDGTIHTAEGITVKLEKGTKGSLAKGEDNAYLYSVTLDSHVFNSNDIKLVVDAIDVSQNEMKAVEASLISIDITAPTVSVHYDNDAVQNEMYFKADRIAIITVTERNWSEDCISINIVGGSLSGWNQSASGANGDGTTWTGYVHFSQEGPCSIEVSTTDRAKNAQNGGTSYYGAAPQNFIIDKTAPVVSYSFDNNSVQNDKYYMASRILTVNVEDVYFAGANDIVVLSNGQASGMTFNGMTATYAFVSDGVYSFRGTVTDLAGNVSAPFEGSEFVVDLTVPTVEFAGIEDQKAYGPEETFEPNVVFTDTNFYEGGVTFDLVRENWNGQDAPITGGYSELMYMLGQRDTAPNSRNDLYQLTNTAEEIDGLYTLTVYVNDQAGNSNSHGVGDVIQFSINRYGSVYLLDEATRAELSGYYMANIPNIVIHEYNLSDAAESWIDIITNAGERIRLETDKDYTVTGEEAAEGCDWRMRTYTILSENFTTDGEYTIEIYVKDDVNNVSTNNDPKAENRGVSVNFIRDTEDPYITLGGPEEGGIYETSEMLMTVTYGDNIRMSKLVVTITDKEGNIIDTKTYAVPVLNEKGEKVLPDGADEELDIYSGQISYMIQEYEETQFVTVTAVDAAGNDTSIEEEGGNNHTVPAISFTLSTKWYVRWYNDKPFFYGTIGAGVGVVALALIAVLLIKRRKDKKKEREA